MRAVRKIYCARNGEKRRIVVLENGGAILDMANQIGSIAGMGSQI